MVTYSQNFSLHNFNFTESGNTKQNMGGETKSFSFIASANFTQLSFGNFSTNTHESWGAALNNVVVEKAPVPEPTTML